MAVIPEETPYGWDYLASVFFVLVSLSLRSLSSPKNSVPPILLTELATVNFLGRSSLNVHVLNLLCFAVLVRADSQPLPGSGAAKKMMGNVTQWLKELLPGDAMPQSEVTKDA